MPRRTPTLAGFGVLGLFWGCWAAVLPDVQHATGASKAGLGAAMLFVTVGSLPAMLLVAGPAVDRFGPRAVAVACAAFAAATALPGLATSLPLLALTLVAAGAGSGALDVGINANVARIESATGARLMPLAHGLYSVGILLGAVGAGLARGAGAGREPILLTVAALILLTAPTLTGPRQERPSRPPSDRRLRLTLERTLVILGLAGAAAFLVEGGMESWSALFLERQLHAHPAVSGLGPGVFGGAMAAGRFFGQASRLADRTLLIGGAALACGGCLIAALAPSPAVALVGFAVGGAGISVNAPIVFGLAGRGRRNAAGAVATVTTIGYVGLLVGPPLVGGVGQLASLRGSFVLLAAVAAAVALVATRLRLD
ncbi:MAG TPA: MFS transporter [Gaiellaceae bacterium]|nr:MFS transporter [Gaiellaceae bacterium]